jgi:glycerol kinase
VCNLERSHTSAHLARAALDAVTHQVADVLECMEQAAGISLPALMADGGATRNSALMQIQADVIGRPVLRSSHEELSARGAAMMGGLTTGWWKSLDDLSALSTNDERFEPVISEEERRKLRKRWSVAVSRARLRDEDA